MGLNIVVGKTGVGKTTRLYDEMIDLSVTTKGQRPILLVVPEQSTLIAQQSLVARHPKHCISGLEVLSFQRLAYRISDDLGIAGKAVLSDTGRHMLIRRIIEASSEEFPFLNKYVHKRGYISELGNLMSEFARYGLAPSDIEGVCQSMSQSMLKYKLADMATLYHKYREALMSDYISGETMMEMMVQNSGQSQLLKEAMVYIDGFFGFTPIQYQMLAKLASVVRELTVTVTLPPELAKGSALDESDLYFESYLTYERLVHIMTADPSYEFDKIFLEEMTGSKTKVGLVDNLYQYPYQQMIEKTDEVAIHRCRSMKHEVEVLRNELLSLVREEGLRYRDIGILAGAPANYQRILERLFGEAGIPYHLDHKKKSVTNEGVDFVLGLIDLYVTGLSIPSVFRILKSDFIDMPSAVVDSMENYVIRYGIRGFKKWQAHWQYSLPDVRKKIDDPMMISLQSELNAAKDEWLSVIGERRLKGRVTVEAHVKSLYELLLSFGFEQELEKKADGFNEASEYSKEREYRQIYKKTMELLDQLIEIAGDTKVTYKEFYDLLEAGFESVELGLVPANVDQVIIGDLTRSRLGNKKVIYVLGVNEGVVPSHNEKAGLLTDEERSTLEHLGMPLAPTAKSSLFREQFYNYMALLGYKDKLILSYASTDEDGKGIRPSHLLTILKKILPGIDVKDKDAGSIDRPAESSSVLVPSVVYEAYLNQLRTGEDADDSVVRWLNSHEPWKGHCNKVREALNRDRVLDRLDGEIVGKLYEEQLSNSVTRLENFAACPFEHFMTYGLEARERERYEITMPHLGMVFHRVIELFSRRMIHRDLDWQDLSESIRKGWVSDLVNEVLEEDQYQVFYDNSRNRYKIARLKAMLDRAVWAIGWQICQGFFRPVDAEWRFDGEQHKLESVNFSLNKGKKMALRGTIDRVDHHSIEGVDYVTVIDYKSSSKEFDLNQFFAGLSLQLIVYLNAACEIRSGTATETMPAGVFYFHIDDPFVSNQHLLSKEDRDDRLLEQLGMKGLVIDDHNVIESLDRYMVKKSKVIPVTRKKDGEFSKSSKTVSLDQMMAIQSYARKHITALGNRIVEGDIAAVPYRMGSRTGCDYCLYRSVCQFDPKDPECVYRDIESQDTEVILDRIVAKVESDN